MRNPPEWIGLVLKLDSLYIHRRGFTSTTTINHQSVLPTRPRREGAPGSARLGRGIGRVRPTGSRLRAGQLHHAGALHPLVAGSIPAPAGGGGVGGPKRSAVARAVASRHDANNTARRPKPMRKPRPGSRHSTIPSAWRSRRHSRTTSGTQGVAGRLPQNLGTSLVGPHPRRRPPHAPRTQRAEVVATRGWQQTRKTGPRSRHEPGDDPWPASNRPGALWRGVVRGSWRIRGPARLARGLARATLIPCCRRTGQTSKQAPEALARQTVTPVLFPFSMAWRRAAATRWCTPPAPSWASLTPRPSFRLPYCTFVMRCVVAAAASLSGVTRGIGGDRCRQGGLADETATRSHRRVGPQHPVANGKVPPDHGGGYSGSRGL